MGAGTDRAIVHRRAGRRRRRAIGHDGAQ